ncbi:hypothetical protein TNCV_1895801 [Trichonephila clavipes]|nr:hypothetical protein TNCV_1895801 [Trichonephila clavipes]
MIRSRLECLTVVLQEIPYVLEDFWHAMYPPDIRVMRASSEGERLSPTPKRTNKLVKEQVSRNLLSSLVKVV